MIPCINTLASRMPFWLETIHNGIHYANSSTHGFILGLSGSWSDAAYVICLYMLLICTVHPIKYAPVHAFLCSCVAILCYGLVDTSFTHVIEGCFTITWIIINCPCTSFNICGHFAEHIINDHLIGGDIGSPILSDPIDIEYATDWYINLFLCLYNKSSCVFAW